LSYFVIPFHYFGTHQLVIKTIVNTLILLGYVYIVYRKEHAVVRGMLK